MLTYVVMLQTFSRPVQRLLVAQGLVGFGGGVFSVLLNLYFKALGHDETIIGRLLALQSFTAALASVPMGTIADLTSRRTTYLLGIVLLAVGSVVCAGADQLWVQVVAIAISGVGNGAVMVSVQPFLQEHSRRRQRPYVFSVNFSIMLVMSIGAGLLAGRLPAWCNRLGYGVVPGDVAALRATLLVGSAFIALGMLPALRLPRRGDPVGSHGLGPQSPASVVGPVPLPATAPAPASPRPDSPAKDDGTGAGSGGAVAAGDGGAPSEQDRAAWRLMCKFSLTSALIGAGAGLIVPYFNLYFRDWVGASVADIGTVFALGQFGTALGGVSSPWLSRRVGMVPGVVLTQVLSLPFMLIMAWRREFWVCAGCFAIRGACMNMGTPIRQSTLMELIPAAWRARAAAADSIAWNLAWSLSMVFSGSIIRDYGYPTCLSATFILYALSSALYHAFFSKSFATGGPS